MVLKSTFFIISPLLFGLLFDSTKSWTMTWVKMFCLIGGLLQLIGYLYDWGRIMYIAYFLLSLGTQPLLATLLSTVSDSYKTNKIGGQCSMLFYLYISYIITYFSTFLFNSSGSYWLGFIAFLVFITVSLGLGIGTSE